MKNRGFILIVFGLLCVLSAKSAPASQGESLLKTKLQINSNKTTVRQVLEHYFPENNIPVSYHDNIIPLNKKLELNSGEKYTVEYILAQICNNENLEFEENDGQVLLKYYDRPESEYKYSIFGRVKDSQTGESLLGATIYIEELSSGVATNGYGVYSITLPQGKYEIRVSFVGYEPLILKLELNKNLHYNISLVEQSTELKNVTVDETDFLDLKAINILSSTNRLDMDMVQSIPYLGEVDVFQSSLLLPGITNIGEGVSGINIRGGSVDQNLIMLDEAVVYNANHFFGLVSIFNPDNVKDVEILKGNLPAKYGGRNSSVIHIRQKEGNENQFHLSGGLGLITSRVMVEGPMLNRNASYLVSARSTFWNVLLKNSSNPAYNNLKASFQDINAKVKFNINNNNKIYISTYLGNDTNKLSPEAIKQWGNRIISLRWNNIVRNRHFFNLTSYYSQYNYRVTNENEFAEFVGESEIKDLALKLDITSYLTPNHILEYGTSMIFHRMNPGERIPGPGSGQNEVSLPTEDGFEPSLYLSSENHFSPKLATSLGFRLSAFHNTGSAGIYVYDEDFPKSTDTIIDTLANTSEARQTYFNLLPRASMKFQLNQLTSIKLGYFQTVQYIHLLSNTVSPSSSDFYKISGKHAEPTAMRQLTLGTYRYFKELDFTGSVEIFYKTLDNTVEFKDGADLLFNEAIETEIITGEERVFGVEIFVKKSFGKLKGWVGYTLSKSEKKIVGKFEEETINDGKYFPTDYDRTHDIAVTAIYAFNNRFSLSSNFVYYTGRPYSFPDSKYSVDGILVPHFPNRNQQRLTGYSRLDLSATLKNRNIKKNGEPKKFESSWVFSIYNVYNRKNTQAYFFTYNENDPALPEVQRLTVLGFIIPTVTYNFKF